jgi:hypothetical protein
VVVAAAATTTDPAKVYPRENDPRLACRHRDAVAGPQEHDGTATPDNFATAIRALIKNQGTVLYDHPALAERFEFAPDATSATFWLRKGVKFHNGEPVTLMMSNSPMKTIGAKADVLKGQTERIESSTTAPSASSSKAPSWISTDLWHRQRQWGRLDRPANIISKSDQMASSKSPSALAHTGWYVRSRARSWS